MGAVPGCVLVISTICLYFYSIDDERAKQIQQELHELRYEEKSIQIIIRLFIVFFQKSNTFRKKFRR
jgi:Na+/melibiose symporter-like transporter